MFALQITHILLPGFTAYSNMPNGRAQITAFVTDICSHRQADRQADRQTDRQTGRQTERQTHTVMD